MRSTSKKKNKTPRKSFMATLRRLSSYLADEKMKIFIVFVFAAASTLFAIIGPKIMGDATTEIFKGVMRKIQNPQEGIDFSKVGVIVLVLIVLYALSSAFSYIQSYTMSGVSQRVTYNLRRDISQKFNRLPISYYDTNSRGDIISRVTNDVDTLSTSLSQSLMQVVTSLITVVGVFVMMMSINVLMSLVAFVVLPITMLVLGLVIKNSQRYFKEQQKYLGQINGRVEESFSGQEVIRGYMGEKYEVTEFNRINNKLYEAGWKSQFLSSVMMPIMMFVGNLGYAVVAIFGGYMAINGRIQVGDIQAFIQYMRIFTQPLNQLAQVMNLLQSTVAAADRIFEFLDEEEIDMSSREKLADRDFRGEIDFKHVRFGYDDDKIIIKDFNLHVKPGQKVAIVGPTGAGKTTLVKLLMRFYMPNSGSIAIDGKDINSLDLESYRSKFAMVLQDTWLFTGTIMDNLRYGKLDASEEEVIKAAKAAYVHRFIMTQAHGYDTVLTADSNNISQGQKQLMTIARAILSNPRILILDEATSSVDTRTEQMIQRAMDNLVVGRTSFIIAHRLSTIRNADLILVLNEGDIVEQGNHEELMKLDGFYSKLYRSQYEGETD